MHVSLADFSPGRRYKVLTALVVPRPIAWITTQHADGTVNAAPFSYFNLMGSDPVVVAVGFGTHGTEPGHAGARDKDTYRLIRETGRFTVNLVDEATAPAMHASAAPLPFGQSEAAALGLSLAPLEGPEGAPPRIAAAPAALSCREHATHLVGDTRVVLGVAEALWVRDGLIDPDTSRVDLAARRAVGRMGGGGYTATREILDLGPRPDAL